MSGGRYGRGKAPERACMPIGMWPARDRDLWQAACASADLLSEDVGSRANRRAISNRKAEKGYGRWLTYLSIFVPRCLAETATARITPERVKAYVAHLQSLQNSSATIIARLTELGEVAKVMGPTESWRFINAIASRIRARHVPARDKSNLKLTDELLSLGLTLMERAESLEGWHAAVQYRDGFIIALLALVPLRRRNIESILLRKNLVEVRGRWIIVLDPQETKTHAAHEVDVPDLLHEPLRKYLRLYRPILADRKGRWEKVIGDALWISKDGSPMTQIAIYDRVRARTRVAFGKALNPHLFRDAAATTLAIADPQHVRVAAPLLGHRTFTTTERYYVQAQGIEAQRRYVETVFKRRGKK